MRRERGFFSWWVLVFAWGEVTGLCDKLGVLMYQMRHIAALQYRRGRIGGDRGEGRLSRGPGQRLLIMFWRADRGVS